MAAPVLAFTTVAVGADTNQATGTLPPTINAGDRLVASLVVDTHPNQADITSCVDGTSDAWTRRVAGITTGATNTAGAHIVVFEKIADGDEGGGTLTITHAGGLEDFVLIMDRWTGAHATEAMQATVVATSATSAPDPANLSASWGAEDNVFISVCAWDRINTGATINGPSGYTFGGVEGTDWEDSGRDSGSFPCLARAYKAVTATQADDCGAWGLSAGAHEAVAAVLVLRPAASASASYFVFPRRF